LSGKCVEPLSQLSVRSQLRGVFDGQRVKRGGVHSRGIKRAQGLSESFWNLHV
jgi:hypothetical protein